MSHKSEMKINSMKIPLILYQNLEKDASHKSQAEMKLLQVIDN